MDKREENARALDPQRFEIAKQMSYMPGGPMMNNPMNVVNTTPQPGSLDGVNRFPYGDSGLENDSRVGLIGPSKNSGQQQNHVRGTGYQGPIAYGTQPQPSGAAQEPMEGVRLSEDARNRGLMSNEFMGMIGAGTPLPGDNGMMLSEQTDRTLGLQGFASLDGVQPSGSTPIKIGRKKGKK